MKMYPITRDQQLWQEEYAKRGMPSSYRLHPSGSVVWFASFLNEHHVTTGRALDIGCGKGRNSLYLAKHGLSIDSMDLVPEAIQQLTEEAKTESVSHLIRPILHDIGSPWPFHNEQFDIAIDIFCFKHQVDPDTKENYHRELRRVLRKGAFYLLTLAGKDDGYYGPLLKQSPDPVRNVVTDPMNNLGSILYSEDDILSEFNDAFDVEYYQNKRNSFTMHGSTYKRSTHLFVLKKCI